MKVWKFSFTVEEGNDEFWEDNPSHQEVYDTVLFELQCTNLYFKDLKMISVSETIETNNPLSKE